MHDKENVPKVAWWRYPLSILAFTVAFFLLPILIGLLLNITNLITPPYYKNSELWIHILSDILSATIGFDIVDKLMLEQNYIFQAIWAAIVAIYSFFVAITNWVLGSSTLEQFLGVLAIGVIAIVFVGLSCKKNKDSNL